MKPGILQLRFFPRQSIVGIQPAAVGIARRNR